MSSLIAPCLCSVTRRHLAIDAVVALAVDSAVESVEWNEDPHVPRGDRAAAELAAKATVTAGLSVASYGSGLRLGIDCPGEFDPVVDSAVLLGAPRIRVRAGGVASRHATPVQRRAVVRDAQLLASVAIDVGVEVVFAQLEGTLADDARATARLLAEVDRPNVLAYWEPRLGQSTMDSVGEVDLLLPKVAGVHVFSWSPGRLRSPLADRAELWLDVIDRCAAAVRPIDVFLEFVPNDDPVALRREVKNLRAFVDGAARPVRRKR